MAKLAPCHADGCQACSYKEEANADAAIRALTAALAPKARVLRDGALHVCPISLATHLCACQ